MEKESLRSNCSGRRKFLKALGGLGIGTVGFHRALAMQVELEGKISGQMIANAEWIAGIELDEDQREEVAQSLGQILQSGEQLRAVPVDADTVPALTFRPDFFYAKASQPGANQGRSDVRVAWSVRGEEISGRSLQLTDSELAFASINQQAAMLVERQISSRELTDLYLQRLRKYDPLINCVVTLLEDVAWKEADASDARRSRGKSLGILDGIPWVAKDLIAIPPWKTTWGAEPFKNQTRNETATVASKLAGAGAVLLAKVSLGALAWGDRWFGGLTRNPWNPNQGSSGSSAGSAAAVSAGLASFALGSETLGSIVSPTRRCRTSGLRPTFGRVSRAGCMPLAWSMDKIGPIARHVDDLAFVFANLLGPDGKDPTLVERSFHWPRQDRLDTLRIGVAGNRRTPVEESALKQLELHGAKIVEVDLESKLPVSAMNFILGVEASTVFDDAFRQDPHADFGRWPRTFERSQFVPAIQYLRANRIRGQLITEAEEKLSKVDVVLGGSDLLLTNLTGHPSVVVACGQDEVRMGNEQDGRIAVPGVVKLTAAAYREDRLLLVADALQRFMPPRPRQPPLDDWLAKMEQQETEPKALQP